MSIEFIRKHYDCQHKVGDVVKIRNTQRVGKILRADGARLVVKGETWQGLYHPDDVLAKPANPPSPTPRTAAEGG